MLLFDEWRLELLVPRDAVGDDAEERLERLFADEVRRASESIRLRLTKATAIPGLEVRASQ